MKAQHKDIRIGFIMGCTMSVPGISGGTMAMALGYYRPILKSACNIRKKKNFFFLLRVLSGGICGFLLCAGLLNYALELLPITVTMLFLSAVVTGIVLQVKETLRKGIVLNGILFFLLGILFVLAIEHLPQSKIQSSPILLLLWGIPLAGGLILPGISTSHLLTVFGLYGAVTDLSADNIVRLIPLIIGVLLGIALLTKPLSAALERWERECNFLLLGFATGSLKSLISPCLNSPQLTYHPFFQGINGLILGAGATFFILKIRARETKNL